MIFIRFICFHIFSFILKLLEKKTLIELSLCILFKIPAGKYVMELVAVDWLKNATRMDNVARRSGCAAQVSYICDSLGSNYKMILYI